LGYFGWSKKKIQVIMVWSGNEAITMDDDGKIWEKKKD
jgi:hypothetical protein